LSDIVERLGKKQRDWLVADELLQEARDEIVRLRAFLSATVETSDANGRRATAAEAERDRLRDALTQVRSEIGAAEIVGARNSAGYLTDRALWAERALSTIDAALKGDTL